MSFLDSDDKNNSASGLSADHGPKPSEVYGFVGSITTVVATGFFFPLIHYFIIYFVCLRVRIIFVNTSHGFRLVYRFQIVVVMLKIPKNAEIISEIA